MKIPLVLISVSPEYDRMARPCFDDILACLGGTLRAMGHEVDVVSELWPAGGRPIVLNYCVAKMPGARPEARDLPDGAIVYNQEAFDTPWANMWADIAHAVRERGVSLWEMRAENVARWREDFGIEAHHVPFGYVPELENVPHAEEKPIDVLFYGSLSPRRAAVLETMSRWRLRVHYHPHSGDGERERLMGRAKTVLSLRFADGYQVETIRLTHALANECFVVCEEGSGIESFEGGLVSSHYDSLTLACADWVGRPDVDRRSVAARGRELARATGQSVRQALELFGF